MRFLPASLLLLAISPCQSVPPDRNDTPPAATDTTAADEGTNDRADEDPVELRTDRAQYRAGDRVGLTLVNYAEATFSFNPCTRTVEREADGGWVPVEEPGRACTMEAWLIEPGATRTADFRQEVNEIPLSLPLPSDVLIAFDPVRDNLRAIEPTGRSFRVEPNSGTLSEDVPLVAWSGLGTPRFSAAAYARSVSGATRAPTCSSCAPVCAGCGPRSPSAPT